MAHPAANSVTLISHQKDAMFHQEDQYRQRTSPILFNEKALIHKYKQIKSFFFQFLNVEYHKCSNIYACSVGLSRLWCFNGIEHIFILGTAYFRKFDFNENNYV